MSGNRLRLARKRAGLSLRELAGRMGHVVTPQAIGKYERGEITPSHIVLRTLADALGVTDDFLMATSQVELGALDFRKHSGTTAYERNAVEAAVLEQVERYLLIEEILGLESAARAAPQPIRIRSLEEAEAASEWVRSQWNLGHDPIPNLTELLEGKGIKVIMLLLPERVSGLTCLVRRLSGPPVPAIIVNQSHGLERRRLTMAHELAHRLLQGENGLDGEKAATRFASAFLQPADHVRSEVGRHRQGFGVQELYVTKRLYRVSAAALLVRFRDVGIISPQTMAYIFQTVGRTWRKTEPEPIETDQNKPLEAPLRYVRLCYRALAEKLIDEEKAAELLGQPLQAVRAAMGSVRSV